VGRVPFTKEFSLERNQEPGPDPDGSIGEASIRGDYGTLFIHLR